jgi:flagellar protein FliL
MRDEETSGTEESGDVKPAGRGGMLVAAAALMISVAAGSAVGIGLVGPKVAAAPRPPAEAEESDGKGKGHGDASKLYAIESLVVNPSGTAGTRFLIATVTVELDDAKSVDLLKAREAATRDALLNVLGGKTVDQLSDVESRDTVRAELATAIAGVVGERRVRKLYLPQWVLQ